MEELLIIWMLYKIVLSQGSIKNNNKIFGACRTKQ